jgi:L-fuculose-phosphate aldolase
MSNMPTSTAGEKIKKMSVSPERAGQELIDACNDMSSAGLVAGTWGNASIRYAGDMIITPSGMPYHTLTYTDLVTMDLSGDIKSGNRRPSTEAPLHLEVYRQRTGVNAVMHTHSIYASALAVARVDLPAILEEQAQLVGGEVKVAEYAPAGSVELARSASLALGQGGAVLLANHGLVGVGQNIREALLVCQIVEKACQIYILSRTIGSPYYLDNEEVTLLRNTFKQNYGQTKKV